MPEPTADKDAPTVTLTDEESRYFLANLRQNLGYAISPIIADTMVGHLEHILAARLADAWRAGAITALDFSTRNEDGIGLSLDLVAHPNPYSTSPGTPTSHPGEVAP